MKEKLPRSIQPFLETHSRIRVPGGWSGAEIYRLDPVDDTEDVLYLKRLRISYDVPLLKEWEVLHWLKGTYAVPKALKYADDERFEYLIITAVDGMPAQKSNLNPEKTALILGSAMKDFHSIPIDDCPFNRKLKFTLQEAADRIKEGVVDPEDFGPLCKGEDPMDVYRYLERHRPDKEDIVLTHGDFCLPNVMVADGKFSGLVDLGRCGKADRYQDIALCVRSLRFNFGEGPWIDLFTETYGINELDEEKIHYYQLLDELS